MEKLLCPECDCDLSAFVDEAIREIRSRGGKKGGRIGGSRRTEAQKNACNKTIVAVNAELDHEKRRLAALKAWETKRKNKGEGK